MTTPPFPLWTAAASDAAFTDPDACAARAAAFARQIDRRNLIERYAGLLQLPFWGALALYFGWVGELLVALTLVLIGGGIVLVLRNLASRAANLPPQPEEPCLAHLERQYRHQLAALQSVPAWYIGPLLPGVLAFYAAVTAGVAEARGWHAALEGAAWPFAVTFGIFALVILLNRVAARSIAAELERLKALA